MINRIVLLVLEKASLVIMVIKIKAVYPNKNVSCTDKKRSTNSNSMVTSPWPQKEVSSRNHLRKNESLIDLYYGSAINRVSSTLVSGQVKTHPDFANVALDIKTAPLFTIKHISSLGPLADT